MNKKTTEQALIKLAGLFDQVSDSEKQLELARKKLSQIPNLNLRGLFKTIDSKGRTFFDIDDLKNFLRYTKIDFNTSHLLLIFNRMDIDKDGIIDFGEFTELVLTKDSPKSVKEALMEFHSDEEVIEETNNRTLYALSRIFELEMQNLLKIEHSKKSVFRVPELDLGHLFRILDCDAKEFIDQENVFEFMNKFIGGVRVKKAMMLFRRVDLDNDGMITFKDWEGFMELATFIPDNSINQMSKNGRGASSEASSIFRKLNEESSYLEEKQRLKELLRKDQKGNVAKSSQNEHHQPEGSKLGARIPDYSIRGQFKDSEMSSRIQQQFLVKRVASSGRSQSINTSDCPGRRARRKNSGRGYSPNKHPQTAQSSLRRSESRTRIQVPSNTQTTGFFKEKDVESHRNIPPSVSQDNGSTVYEYSPIKPTKSRKLLRNVYPNNTQNLSSKIDQKSSKGSKSSHKQRKRSPEPSDPEQSIKLFTKPSTSQKKKLERHSTYHAMLNNHLVRVKETTDLVDQENQFDGNLLRRVVLKVRKFSVKNGGKFLIPQNTNYLEATRAQFKEYYDASLMDERTSRLLVRPTNRLTQQSALESNLGCDNSYSKNVGILTPSKVSLENEVVDESAKELISYNLEAVKEFKGVAKSAVLDKTQTTDKVTCTVRGTLNISQSPENAKITARISKKRNSKSAVSGTPNAKSKPCTSRTKTEWRQSYSISSLNTSILTKNSTHLRKFSQQNSSQNAPYRQIETTPHSIRSKIDSDSPQKISQTQRKNSKNRRKGNQILKRYFKKFINQLETEDKTSLINIFRDLIKDQIGIEAKRGDLSERFDCNLFELFNVVTRGKGCRVDKEQLLKFLKFLEVPLITRKDCDFLIKRYNRDDSGTLNFTEFKKMFLPSEKSKKQNFLKRSFKGIQDATDFTYRTRVAVREAVEKVLIAEKNLDYSRDMIYSILKDIYEEMDEGMREEVTVGDFSDVLMDYGVDAPIDRLLAIFGRSGFKRSGFEAQIQLDRFIEMFAPLGKNALLKVESRC